MKCIFCASAYFHHACVCVVCAWVINESQWSTTAESECGGSSATLKEESGRILSEKLLNITQVRPNMKINFSFVWEKKNQLWSDLPIILNKNLCSLSAYFCVSTFFNFFCSLPDNSMVAAGARGVCCSSQFIHSETPFTPGHTIKRQRDTRQCRTVIMAYWCYYGSIRAAKIFWSTARTTLLYSVR